jgi:hypothetical protein
MVVVFLCICLSYVYCGRLMSMCGRLMSMCGHLMCIVVILCECGQLMSMSWSSYVYYGHLMCMCGQLLIIRGHLMCIVVILCAYVWSTYQYVWSSYVCAVLISLLLKLLMFYFRCPSGC